MEQFYLIWLAALSVITFVAYGYDKGQARRGAWRVSERTLHLLALLGGFLGGWLGMFVFHHKTRHPSFIIILLLATVLHLFLYVYLIT